jgi:hypothetical protein
MRSRSIRTPASRQFAPNAETASSSGKRNRNSQRSSAPVAASTVASPSRTFPRSPSTSGGHSTRNSVRSSSPSIASTRGPLPSSASATSETVAVAVSRPEEGHDRVDRRNYPFEFDPRPRHAPERPAQREVLGGCGELDDDAQAGRLRAIAGADRDRSLAGFPHSRRMSGVRVTIARENQGPIESSKPFTTDRSAGRSANGVGRSRSILRSCYHASRG